jgi:hypothetical protein
LKYKHESNQCAAAHAAADMVQHCEVKVLVMAADFDSDADSVAPQQWLCSI